MFAVVGAAVAATSGALLKNKADCKKYAKELNQLKEETVKAQELLEKTTMELRQEQLKALQTAQALQTVQLKHAATEEALVQLSQKNVGENTDLMQKLIMYEQDIARLRQASRELEMQLEEVRAVKQKDDKEHEEKLKKWISELLGMLRAHKDGAIPTAEFVAQLVTLLNDMGTLAGVEEISPMEFMVRECARSLAGSVQGSANATPQKGNANVFFDDWEDKLRLALSSPTYLAKLMQAGGGSDVGQLENTEVQPRVPMRLPLTPVNRRLVLAEDDAKATQPKGLTADAEKPLIQPREVADTVQPKKAAAKDTGSTVDSEGNVRATKGAEKKKSLVGRKPANKAKIVLDLSLEEPSNTMDSGFALEDFKDSDTSEKVGRLFLR
uniref:Uncharacterized protein n=1 Tax=Pyramimonas obovata TaxID=1411642 RepID=A0A7S0N6Z0_9CHLO|mmetsp:Transcript_22172/g.48659  ORF Transcript_22172/g.48659 Transcript_22172/m.48659 type:complete len:383 (+) Transcript_22172:206-1354(+)